MARIKKKGKAGQAKNFITRTQAVRKLQVSLPDFRRLCIFKGIYPREPRNKKKASKTAGPNTTFYYSKDIQYLLHEPLLARFRDHKAVSKKIARSLGKGEVGDAARLDKTHNKKLSLDHIIKERYPTFVDALRDLDDALSLLFLFANLPSDTNVPPKTIALCQRLCHEFQHYLIVSHSLRRSFISIKGIYYQATIQGQDILWLVPHKFVQRVTGDVDLRIMGTFVEFYTTLLGFVNYRLYTTIGLVYPPKLDAKADEEGAELGAFTLESKGLANGNSTKSIASAIEADLLEDQAVDEKTQQRVDELSQRIGGTEEADTLKSDQTPALEQAGGAIDTFEAAASGGDVLPQPSSEPAAASSLFQNMVFFFNREAPRQPLEFLIRAFGGKRIGWDSVAGGGAFTHDELNPAITHQIVDRPPVMESNLSETQMAVDEEESVEKPKTFQYGFRIPERTYVQPQWIWDCVNAGKILRADLYAPGALLPPHLSPFVRLKDGEYDPTKSLAEQEHATEALEFEEAEREAAALENGDAEDASGDASDDAEEDDVEDSDGGMQVAESENSEAEGSDEEDGDDATGSDDSEDEDELDEEAQAAAMHQAELEAEAKGLTPAEAARQEKLKQQKTVSAGNSVRRKAEKKRLAEEEERTRRMGMMPRKKKKLYEKMQHGRKRDSDDAQRLRAKRRRLEKNVVAAGGDSR